MIVFVRPTGFPIGQTLGFSPNGSAASLDTAPVNTSLLSTDVVLIESGGALCKVDPALLAGAGALTVSNLTALVAALPTALPPAPGELWLNAGVLSLS